MAMRRACSYDLRAQSPLHICYRNRPTCHIYHGASKDYKHISNIESHAKNSKLIMVEIYVAQSGIYARTIMRCTITSQCLSRDFAYLLVYHSQANSS